MPPVPILRTVAVLIRQEAEALELVGERLLTLHEERAHLRGARYPLVSEPLPFATQTSHIAVAACSLLLVVARAQSSGEP